MGLLGPNGSGKTTILRILTGYLRPSSGTARIAGLDIVDDSLAARRRVGYVPEDAPLYLGMRVNEFLAFMGRLKGLAGTGLTTAVDTAADRLGLGPMRAVQIGRLSRGYRQRVAIAQALLGNPSLLILDEPTNGLDPRQIIEMRELIRSLGDERTILVTSHILGEIERVADRVAILLAGRLLAVHAVRGSADGTRFRLCVRGDQERVRLCLTRVPGVVAVALEGQGRASPATYLVDADHASVAESVAGAVITAGFGLVSLQPLAIDLEALFLRLTGDQPDAAR
jgi:ABC-2 type transport system ATP-binding protein